MAPCSVAPPWPQEVGWQQVLGGWNFDLELHCCLVVAAAGLSAGGERPVQRLLQLVKQMYTRLRSQAGRQPECLLALRESLKVCQPAGHAWVAALCCWRGAEIAGRVQVAHGRAVGCQAGTAAAEGSAPAAACCCAAQWLSLLVVQKEQAGAWHCGTSQSTQAAAAGAWSAVAVGQLAEHARAAAHSRRWGWPGMKVLTGVCFHPWAGVQNHGLQQGPMCCQGRRDVQCPLPGLHVCDAEAGPPSYLAALLLSVMLLMFGAYQAHFRQGQAGVALFLLNSAPAVRGLHPAVALQAVVMLRSRQACRQPVALHCKVHMSTPLMTAH